MFHGAKNKWGKKPQESEETHYWTHECKEIFYPHKLAHVFDKLVVIYDRIVDGPSPRALSQGLGTSIDDQEEKGASLDSSQRQVTWPPQRATFLNGTLNLLLDDDLEKSGVELRGLELDIVFFALGPIKSYQSKKNVTPQRPSQLCGQNSTQVSYV